MFNPHFVEIQLMGLIRNFGYSYTPSRHYERENIRVGSPNILIGRDRKSTVLWPCLFEAWPNWNFGLQGTGDCVSWMVAHMCDLSDAVRNLFNPRIRELVQTASEAIYAFGKCELYNSYRFHSAGMMGIDGIQAVQKFGRLFRKAYPDCDLTKYDGEKAELWAEAPRSTHGVPDYLEPFAETHKVLKELEVTDCDAAGALIEFGYPVGYCGNTYWGMETDKEGNAVSFEEGAHAMVLTGVKYRDGEASHFWVANTGHGDHVEYNGFCSLIPESYRNCGSWVPTERIGPVLRRGDCFAISLDGNFEKHSLMPNCFNPSYMI